MRRPHVFVVSAVLLALISSVGLGETSPSLSPPAESGIEGIITVSPVRGGPIREGDPASAPLPETPFVVRQGDRAVASFETDAQGRFKVALPPGSYTVAASQPRKIGRYGPWPIEVIPGQMTQVTWNCDSGMR